MSATAIKYQAASKLNAKSTSLSSHSTQIIGFSAKASSKEGNGPTQDDSAAPAPTHAVTGASDDKLLDEKERDRVRNDNLLKDVSLVCMLFSLCLSLSFFLSLLCETLWDELN